MHGEIEIDLTDVKCLAQNKRTPSEINTSEYNDVVIKLSDGAQDWFERNDVAEWGEE